MKEVIGFFFEFFSAIAQQNSRTAVNISDNIIAVRHRFPSLWTLMLTFGLELDPTQDVKRKMQVNVISNKAIRWPFLKSTRGCITYNRIANFPDTA